MKCWTTKNSLCFTTFNDHEGAITDIKFMPKKGNAILTSSQDGTVRAFDLVKYKNFRTLKPNKQTQLTCLAIESSGDIVCAGSNDPFNVFVWSLKTGQLIDILNGHTAPVSSLNFSATSGMLTSSSWIKQSKLGTSSAKMVWWTTSSTALRFCNLFSIQTPMT